MLKEVQRTVYFALHLILPPRSMPCPSRRQVVHFNLQSQVSKQSNWVVQFVGQAKGKILNDVKIVLGRLPRGSRYNT